MTCVKIMTSTRTESIPSRPSDDGLPRPGAFPLPTSPFTLRGNSIASGGLRASVCRQAAEKAMAHNDLIPTYLQRRGELAVVQRVDGLRPRASGFEPIVAVLTCQAHQPQAGAEALLGTRAVLHLPTHDGGGGWPQPMSLAGVHCECARCEAGMCSATVLWPPLRNHHRLRRQRRQRRPLPASRRRCAGSPAAS